MLLQDEMKLHDIHIWHKFFSEAPNCFGQKNHWHLSMWCGIYAMHSRFYMKGIIIFVFFFFFFFFLRIRIYVLVFAFPLPHFFFFQFSVTSLLQINFFLYFLQFQQLHCHNFFFFTPILATWLSQFPLNFFSPPPQF